MNRITNQTRVMRGAGLVDTSKTFASLWKTRHGHELERVGASPFVCTSDMGKTRPIISFIIQGAGVMGASDFRDGYSIHQTPAQPITIE